MSWRRIDSFSPVFVRIVLFESGKKVGIGTTCKAVLRRNSPFRKATFGLVSWINRSSVRFAGESEASVLLLGTTA